ncbi:hypothetical protein L6R21_27830 [bacterium]|nr:hypothetical protein [bacterium]
MKPASRNMYGVALTMAIICTFIVIYAMVAIILFREQVFLERGTISAGGEMSLLIAFSVMLLFDLVSVLWLWSRARVAQFANKGDLATLALGILSLMLLTVDKILVDEISHEYALGAEALGEGIVLYVCLAMQLCYCLVIVRALYRAYTTR